MEVREQDQDKQEDKSGSTKSPPCTSLVLSFSTFNTSSALSARVRQDNDNRMVPCGGSSSFYYALDAARSRSCACDPIRSGASQVRRRRRSSCTGHIGRCRGECEVGQLSIFRFFPLPPRLQDLHCMHEIICRLWSEDQRLGVEIGPGCVRAHYCRVSSKNRYLALRTNP